MYGCYVIARIIVYSGARQRVEVICARGSSKKDDIIYYITVRALSSCSYAAYMRLLQRFRTLHIDTNLYPWYNWACTNQMQRCRKYQIRYKFIDQSHLYQELLKTYKWLIKIVVVSNCKILLYFSEYSITVFFKALALSRNNYVSLSSIQSWKK